MNSAQLVRVLLLALLVASFACTRHVDAETEILVRLSTRDEGLKRELSHLAVRVASRTGTGWRKPPSAALVAHSDLRWPVDLPITPRTPGDALKQFEVVIEALRDREVLAQARAITSFVPRELRVLELEIFRCRSLTDEACLSSACEGEECVTCKAEDRCEPVGVTDTAVLGVLAGDRPGVREAGAVVGDDGFDADVAASATDASTQSADSDAGVTPAKQDDAGSILVEPARDGGPGIDGGAPPLDQYALGEEGQACMNNQALACAGHASARVLQCRSGLWTLAKSCATNERCDSRTSTQPGVCLPVPSACVDKAPGDVCEQTARVSCGIDLVSVENHACPKDAHCVATGSVGCACDKGFRADGSGGCMNPNDCTSQACTNGTCRDGLDDYSCDCPTGFTGTGTKQCTKVLYCPANACAPGGTCVDQQSWSCMCGSGFSGTGSRSCTNVNDCPSTCKAPNGTCTDGVNTYSCACNAGFSGPACATDVCNPNPCPAGSVCSRTGTRCTRVDAGQGNGQDVITIGDSWMSFDASSGVQFSLEKVSGRDYRNYAVSGTKLLDGVIPNQYVSARSAAPDIKTVVMTGGSNDILQDSLLNCLDSDFDGSTTCKARIDQVAAGLGQLWTQMASDGVRDIVMVSYSNKQTPLGLGGATKMTAYFNTKVGAACAAVQAPSRCLFFDTDRSVPNLVLRSDGLHPDAASFDAIGSAVWQLMQAQGIRR